jgi:hypothetical protein
VDLATLTNAPRDITLDGKTYKVSALTLAEWGELQQWIKDHADPVVKAFESLNRARASGVVVTEIDRKALMAQARAEARSFPPKPGSQAWNEALDNTEGGQEEFVGSILKKHQPDLPDAAITKLTKWLDDDDHRDSAWDLVSAAMGIPDPKIQPPDEGVTAPTTDSPDPTSSTTGE